MGLVDQKDRKDLTSLEDQRGQLYYYLEDRRGLMDRLHHLFLRGLKGQLHHLYLRGQWDLLDRRKDQLDLSGLLCCLLEGLLHPWVLFLRWVP